MRKTNFKLSTALLLALLTLAMFGCARNVLVTGYFLLEYQPNPIDPRLQLKEPLPYRVQVLTFKIPRSYDSIRIIARFSSHQINYYRYSLWAVRPQVAVADMLARHINTYNLFRDCQREYLEERPDLEISGEIQQIERYESENFSAAHLKMSFTLSDYDTYERLVKYEFDREMRIPREDMTIFAKAVSDIVRDESEKFLVRVVEYFQPSEPDTAGVEP